MTASTASNTRSAFGARRLLGRRAIVALAIGASATLALSACGAGQIAQTSSQHSAVTGTEAAIGAIGLHNVQLIYPSQETAREQNQLMISFVAVNTDPVVPDTLESITVNGQKLTLTGGNFTIAPNTSISTPLFPAYSALPTESTAATATGTASSTPAATLTPAQSGKAEPLGSNPPPSIVTVSAINNGKVGAIGESVPVEFTFANAGTATLSTPIAVWHDVPRLVPTTAAPAGGH